MNEYFIQTVKPKRFSLSTQQLNYIFIRKAKQLKPTEIYAISTHTFQHKKKQLNLRSENLKKKKRIYYLRQCSRMPYI